MSRVGWWELAAVSSKLGFSSDNECRRLVKRLISHSLIGADYFSADGLENKIGRGRPRHVIHLSPAAVVVVAAHARTPEAAAFRREALAALATMPSNALPAAPSAELSVLHRFVVELEQRVNALTTRQDAVVERVEKIEARVPEQLQLPMVCEVDDVAKHVAVIATLEKLITAVNGPNGARGLLSREIFDLMASGHVAALELREAVRAVNGGRMPATPSVFGKILQRVCDSNSALVGQWGHNHTRRWIIASNGVH